MESTFDELRTCPRCGQLGSPAGTDPQADGSTIHKFTCENPSCRWFHSSPWLRQRRRDGSWVEEQQHKKFFPAVADRTEEVQASIDREIARSMGQNI